MYSAFCVCVCEEMAFKHSAQLFDICKINKQRSVASSDF